MPKTRSTVRPLRASTVIAVGCLTLGMFAKGLAYNCQLSHDLGVTESTLSRWRRGNAMSTDHAVKLARHLGVTLDWLVTGRLYTGEVVDAPPRHVADIIAKYAGLPDDAKRVVLKLSRLLGKRGRGRSWTQSGHLRPICLRQSAAKRLHRTTVSRNA